MRTLKQLRISCSVFYCCTRFSEAQKLYMYYDGLLQQSVRLQLNANAELFKPHELQKCSFVKSRIMAMVTPLSRSYYLDVMTSRWCDLHNRVMTVVCDLTQLPIVNRPIPTPMQQWLMQVVTPSTAVLLGCGQNQAEAAARGQASHCCFRLLLATITGRTTWNISLHCNTSHYQNLKVWFGYTLWLPGHQNWLPLKLSTWCLTWWCCQRRCWQQASQVGLKEAV